MTERARSGYRRLVEVRVLHHYWLDDGATTFNDIADQAVRTRRLLRYDVRRFLAIAPSPATTAVLTGLRGVCRTTGLGLVVALPDDATVEAASSFDFFLVPLADEFANYTAMSLRPQRVIEIVDSSSGRTARYKEGTPVLSNLTGASRTWNGDKQLFLSSEYPAGSGERVEELVASGSQLCQLTGDQPGATLQQLGPVADLPVYLHQGDAPVPPPALTVPPGVVGAPARGIELSADTPDDVLAVVRLSPVRADDNDFSLVDGGGHLRTACPVLEIHLKNRATTWRYRNRRDGSVISTELQPRPLTYFGNAGTKQKPNTGSVGVERDVNAPARVARVMSEIFV